VVVSMRTTVKIGKTVTSKDHLVCATFAFLMTFSAHLALIPNFIWSMLGFWLLYRNWETFDSYCKKRRDGMK